MKMDPVRRGLTALRFRVFPTVHSSTPVTQIGIALGLPQFVEEADLLMAAVDEVNLPLGHQLRERTHTLWAPNEPALRVLGTTT